MNHCPACNHPLDAFALSCPQCQHSLIGQPVAEMAASAGVIPLAADAESVLEEPLGLSAASPSSSLRLGRPGSHDPEGHDPPLPVDLRIHKAKELIAADDYEKALLFLNRAIADAPADRLAECHSLRGYVLYRQGDVVGAERECTRAIEQNWEDANTFAWRAAARGEQQHWRQAFDDLHTACELAGAQRDNFYHLMESYSEAARDHFRDELKQAPTADLFFERGWVYYRCSRLVKAERDFKQALSLDATHAWAALGLALVFMQAGVEHHVESLLELALQGPLECQRMALTARARRHHLADRPQEAVRDLNRLLKRAADEGREIVAACRLRAELGHPIEAIERLTLLLADHPQEYAGWWVRGQAYQQIKNYPLAIKDYGRFLQWYPEHLEARIHRAQCFLATGRWDAAHEDLDLVLDLEEDHYEGLLLRSQILLKQERLDQALTAVEQAIRVDNRAQAFAVKAEIFQKLCDFGSAIEEYSRAIEMAHEDWERKAEYQYLRGTMLYNELQEYESALRDFQASCQLRPNHSGSWVWRAATASRLEDWPQAIESLERAIDARPAASAPYQKLGTPVAKRAVDFFDRQQQRGQANSDTFRHRGMAHQFLGQNESALADFTQALERHPEDGATRIRRGQVLHRLQQYEAALEDFTRVIQQNSDDHWARYCRAITRAASGQLDRARSDLRKAIRVAPQHPRYHIQLSEQYQKLGQTDKVLRCLDKSLVQDPTNAVAYRRRAAVHSGCGNLLQAIRDYTHALELDPSQIEVLVQRGQVYLRLGENSLAREDFELALTHNPVIAKAYSGRATTLLEEDKLEYTLIWLTKAIHRFDQPRDLAEILFARGKIFVQMGRLAPAAADFSAVIDLVRDDPATLVAARHARARANLQAQRYDKAAKDYRRILRIAPEDRLALQALKWLERPIESRSELFPQEGPVRRPTRPSVVRNAVTLSDESRKKWEIDPPHDTWIVRAEDKKEYGPVHYNILLDWITNGRVDLGMRLLRADWSKWKRAESIFPEIVPFEGATFVTDFPGINVG